jgi:arsenate reductase
MKNLLFMCVANSARSQLAEGLARKIFQGHCQVESAGSQPTSVNPWAVKALAEVGIDISGHRSKTVDALPKEFLQSLEAVITLCAEEVCPVLPYPAKRLHWPLPDPAGRDGGSDEQLQRFRETRDTIAARLNDLAVELGVAT